MFKIRKGDTVVVTKGKDAGKKGKVIEVVTAKNKVLVEGINTVKKHKRQTRQDQTGGIISVERPLSVSNVLLYCKNCDRGVRTGFSLLKDGTKTRLCKRCKEAA
jgi:large subunit ribosomal protein L24